jgi:hypothetical protein
VRIDVIALIPSGCLRGILGAKPDDLHDYMYATEKSLSHTDSAIGAFFA